MSSFSRLIRTILVFSCAVFLSSCAIWSSMVSKFFPPLTDLDQRYQSIMDNMAQVDNFETFAGAFVSEATLRTLVEHEIQRAIQGAGSPTLTLEQLEPTFALVEQGIMIGADFKFVDTKNKLKGEGGFSGVIAISSRGDLLILRPAFKDVSILDLARVDGGGAVDKLAANAVKSLLENYISNLNGKFLKSPATINLAFSETLELDLNQSIAEGQGAVKAKKMAHSISLKTSLLLVTPKGIAMLADMAPGNSASEEVEVTDSELGLGISEGQFKKAFKAYNKAFTATWEGSLDATPKDTHFAVALAKSQAAETINALLAQTISVSQSFKTDRAEFDSTVRASSEDIDCSKARKPFRYNRYRRASCDWDCQVCVLGVCTDDPACVTSRGACNVAEEARVAADNIRREAQKAEHDIKQEANVAACNVKRELADFTDLGRFTGKARFAGDAKATLKNATMTPDMSKLSLAITGSITGKLHTDLKIQPLDIGHLFLCTSAYRKNWSSKTQASLSEQPLSIELTASNEEQDLIIKGQPSPLGVDIKIDPAPIKALMSDRKFRKNCAIGSTILYAGVSAAKFVERLGMSESTPGIDQLLGDFSMPFEPGAFEFRVRGQEVKVTPEHSLKARAQWGEKSIMVISRK